MTNPSPTPSERKPMKLEDQLCSLELAKKLKDLGVKQESAFDWVESPKGTILLRGRHETTRFRANKTCAFTVAELGEIMTEVGHGVVSCFGDTACATLVKKEWWITGGNWLPAKQKYDHLETDAKWADALAKMLIYLIEKGIVKP